MTIRKLGKVSSDFVALGKSREKYSNGSEWQLDGNNQVLYKVNGGM